MPPADNPVQNNTLQLNFAVNIIIYQYSNN